MTTQETATRSAAALIRNEPVQARSTARLAALLDAAARTVDEIGYERLTTAMVADGAGASIGTVYRYFPDRIAVLQSLALRNVERVGDAVVAALPGAQDWRGGLGRAFDALVDAFRTEPGFASLRFGDVIDLRPVDSPPAGAELAVRVHRALVEAYGVADDGESLVATEAALVVADALIERAFAHDAAGDPGFLARGRAAMLAQFDQR
ncbi:MAG: TetR/AcrR family transcriptional regulator [Micrococcales bacterium]|nr:TetR/AcrR family transcriptional regulator [Micrococcales bacterium]